MWHQRSFPFSLCQGQAGIFEDLPYANVHLRLTLNTHSNPPPPAGMRGTHPAPVRSAWIPTPPLPGRELLHYGSYGLPKRSANEQRHGGLTDTDDTLAAVGVGSPPASPWAKIKVWPGPSSWRPGEKPLPAFRAGCCFQRRLCSWAGGPPSVRGACRAAGLCPTLMSPALTSLPLTCKDPMVTLGPPR